MITDHKNVRENLLALVKLFPAIKDNYNLMLYHYWAIYDSATSIDAIGKATPAETITRNFRKLVEVGLVTPSEETLAKRKAAEKSFTNEFSHMA